MSVEVAYVGNRGGNVFAGDGPEININQATINGYPGVPRNQRRPYFNQFGWTQDVGYFCNCATNAYDALQAKLTKRFSQGYSLNVNYTLQKAEQDSDRVFPDAACPRQRASSIRRSTGGLPTGIAHTASSSRSSLNCRSAPGGSG